MESGSVLSEPVITSAHRGFLPTERSSSMTIISSQGSFGKPRMSQLENLEAKMANIEVSLSSSNPGRRRKGTSLNGTISARTSPRPESKELRSALQDREAVIQNLRIQLCLGKLPRPTGPPLDDSERPAAEQKLNRLKIDAENKRIAIRNLKSALDKLDITDNIDTRIRQAELEYALGREELQLLSIVEEARALQMRLDKSKPESNTLYSIIQSGISLSLHAVHSTVGRWAASSKPDYPGLYVEWALDGEGLYRGDRILEVNGKVIAYRTREELQKHIGTSGRCQLVVVRRKSSQIPNNQIVQQQQEDNLRLQHRISYLEEQVRELQTTKEIPITPLNGTSGHVTSISISSPPSTPPDKPQIFQRGNYVTTLVGGKPIELTGLCGKTHITKTMIKENGHHTDSESNYFGSNRGLSGSKMSINSDHPHTIHSHHKQADDSAFIQRSSSSHFSEDNRSFPQGQSVISTKPIGHFSEDNRSFPRGQSIISAKPICHFSEDNRSFPRGQSVISANTIGHFSEDNRSFQQRYKNMNTLNNEKSNGSCHGKKNHQNYAHARSVEHLNYKIDRRKDSTNGMDYQNRKFGNDLRSVKSLDFESDSNDKKRTLDYTSEPVAPRIRPTPPKKPLRLSLQRAQSLQTVELNQVNEIEKKRSLKRAHKSEKGHESQYIENNVPLQTASLGRHKHI